MTAITRKAYNVPCSKTEGTDEYVDVSNDSLFARLHYCPHRKLLAVGHILPQYNNHKEATAEQLNHLVGGIKDEMVKRKGDLKYTVAVHASGHVKKLLHKLGGKSHKNGLTYLNHKKLSIMEEEDQMQLPKATVVASEPKSNAGKKRLQMDKVKHKVEVESDTVDPNSECHYDEHESHVQDECPGSKDYCEEPVSCSDARCDGPWEGCEYSCSDNDCHGPEKECGSYDDEEEKCTDDNHNHRCTEDDPCSCSESGYHSHCNGTVNYRTGVTRHKDDDFDCSELHDHCEESHCSGDRNGMDAEEHYSIGGKHIMTVKRCFGHDKTHVHDISTDATPHEVRAALQKVHRTADEDGHDLSFNGHSAGAEKHRHMFKQMGKLSASYSRPTIYNHHLAPISGDDDDSE